ncbi:DUF2705 family protein [Terribacillus saccharophilus]|uniref:DUF2705 family protein n=1 Tax=Terribacillus saccharophilus TaxID=361277 RepID=UPI00384D8572
MHKTLIFVLLSILIQPLLYLRFDIDFEVPAFLLGVPVTSALKMNYEFMLYWYLPIATLTFYFTGFFKENLSTYGILKITRNYNIRLWLFNRYKYIVFFLIIFVLLQLATSYLYLSTLVSDNTHLLLWTLRLSINYFITLFVIISLQLLLELFTSPQTAQLTINLYIVFSLLSVNEIYLNHWASASNISYIMLANYGMGYKSGYDIPNINTDIINSGFLIPILAVVGSISIFISYRRLKSMDII